MAPLEINVTGSSIAYHPAERSMLSLRISSHSKPTAQEADTIVATVLNSLCDAIAPYCAGKTLNDSISTDNAPIAQYSISTSDTVRGHGGGGNISSSMSFSKTSRYDPVFSTTAELSIEFRDFGLLARIATQVSSMENVKIENLHWKLTLETQRELESRVRKEAAQQAIRKARDYAEVFGGNTDGSEKVQAVLVKETVPYNRLTRNRVHVGKEGVGMVQKSEWDYEPIDVGVEGKVEGKFVVE